MKNIKLTKRDAYFLTALCVPMFIDLLVTYFFYQDIKADPYIFYSHSRYLDNIFYDIRNMLFFSISSYILSRYNRLFSPFFYISLVEIIMYFLFYKQQETYLELPIFVIMILWTMNKKQI